MKAAIFVEGHTEAAFVKALISEVAGSRNLLITEEYFSSGTFVLSLNPQSAGQRSEVLIANCCSDGKVATAIRDRYAGLVAAGYGAVIGLRDIYPEPSTQLMAIKQLVSGIMPKGPVPSEMCFAVPEVEAWFIEEETHFSRVHASLDQASILAGTGYDILSGRAETIPHPAAMLHNMYSVANLAYRKKQNHIARTVSALDMANLYIGSRQRSKSLDEFILAIDGLGL